MMQLKENEESQGHKRSQRGRGRDRGRGRGRGHGRGWNSNSSIPNNYEKGESSTRGRRRGNSNLRYDKSQVQCYNCQKFWHYASKCRAPSSKVDKRSNYVEVKTEEKKTVLLACRDNNGDQENAWYLDTGASNHMCGRRSMFVELDESVAGNVSFGDNSKISVKGK
ncbi:hypothetical protein ACOSQ2_029363 [Xanthoceras sorbifolium]